MRADNHEAQKQKHGVVVQVRRLVTHDIAIEHKEQDKGDECPADEPFRRVVGMSRSM